MESHKNIWRIFSWNFPLNFSWNFSWNSIEFHGIPWKIPGIDGTIFARVAYDVTIDVFQIARLDYDVMGV
jgi:hypothetical protein